MTHSAMRRASVHANGMSLVPNAPSVTLAFMAWRALTHMDVDSVSVMGTPECVE